MAQRVERSSQRPAAAFVLLAALALGAASVVAQSLWVRELSLLWFGSELCWGMTLSAWLLGVAAGAAGAGALSRRVRPAVLAAAFALLLAATLPAGLWVLRSARSLLGTGAGEFIPTGQMLALTGAVAGGTGLWVGALFPAGCALAGAAFGAARRTIGIFFLTEAIGTLAGGVAFTFWWVERLDAFTLTAALSAGLLAMVGGACAARRAERRGGLNLTCGLVAAAAGGAAIAACFLGYTAAAERASQDRRWAGLAAPAIRHVAGTDSRFGRIDLGEHEGQWSLYLNCRPAGTFPNRRAIQPFVHFAASECPRLQRALVIGTATGEIAAELRRYPGVTVDAVELDEKVHDVLSAHVRPAPAAPTHFADGRHFLKTSRVQYDLIILAVGDPTSIAAGRFYTREFFQEARRALSGDGVLAFSLSGPTGEISPELRDYLGVIYRSADYLQAGMLWTWGDPSYALVGGEGWLPCSGPGSGYVPIPGFEPTQRPQSLVARYHAHGGPDDFDPEYFLGWSQDRLQPERLKALQEALASADVPANTDARPIAMFLYMKRAEQALLSTAAGPAGRKRTSLLALLGKVGSSQAFAAAGLVAAVVCATVALRRRTGGPAGRPGRLALLFSLATTGLAMIALEIVLLAAFQNLYGYVYSHIALIVAVYMAGVAAGSWTQSRRGFPPPPQAWGRLVLLDLAMLLGCLALPGLLDLLGRMPAGAAPLALTEGIILAMVAAAGLAGGMAVPLAAGLYRTRSSNASPGGPRQTGSVAGAVDAADCLGGAVGALACGLLLLPLLGRFAACGVFALLKLAAIVALLISRPRTEVAPPS